MHSVELTDRQTNLLSTLFNAKGQADKALNDAVMMITPDNVAGGKFSLDVDAKLLKFSVIESDEESEDG